MLNKLVAICYLHLAVIAAEKVFYCNTNGAKAIKESEFYIITRDASSFSYSPGLKCEFSAQSNAGSLFFIEILSFQVETAILTISSGNQTIFDGSWLESYQRSISTSSGSLHVRFNAGEDLSVSAGVELRVREFDRNRCPPGWSYLHGNCFGSSNTTGNLNFLDSQRACNSMRSNLLQIPWDVSDIGFFIMRQLPGHLRTYTHHTWIGLTDATDAGQFKPYWLNGNWEHAKYLIGCLSGGKYSTCSIYERCGIVHDSARTSGSTRAIFMDRCAALNAFACSMPPEGTDQFYHVSSIILTPKNIISPSWLYGLVVSCLFVASLITCSIFCRLRKHRTPRSSVSATSIAVTSGPVAIVLPEPPPYSLEPPSYESAVQSTNRGHAK